MQFFSSARDMIKYDIRITSEQIKKKLDEKFPLTKTYLYIFKITFQNPEVMLLDVTDKVRLCLDTILNIKIREHSKPLRGSAEVISGIDFDTDSGKFFLTDCQIEKLHVDGIPDKYISKVNKVANMATKELLYKYPVYTLRAKDAKTTAAKLLLKKVVVSNGAVIVTLGI